MSSSSRRRRQLQVRENNICSFLTPKSSKGDNSEEGKVGKGLSIRTKGQKSASFRTEGDKDMVEFFDDKENVSPNIGPTSSQATSLKPSSDTKNRTSDTKNRFSPDDVTKSSQSEDGVEKLSDDVTPDEDKNIKMDQKEIIAFLTQEDPGEKYYQILADERRRALADTLAQNEELTAENSELRDRNAMLQAQLDSALELVELYQKIIDGSPTAEDPEDNADTPSETKDIENSPSE